MNVVCVMLTSWPKRAGMAVDAFRSYEAQDYPARRLLIVNDGERIESLRQDVQIVNIRHGQSIGAKRQLALQSMRPDEWCVAWDDDDVMLPMHIRGLMASALNNRAQYAISSCVWIADATMRIGLMRRRKAYASSCFNAGAALQCGGFPPVGYGEDFQLYSRMGPQGRVICDYVTYVHRRHGSNTTSERALESKGSAIDEDALLAQAVRDQMRRPDPDIAKAQAEVDRIRAMPATIPWRTIV